MPKISTPPIRFLPGTVRLLNRALTTASTEADSGIDIPDRHQPSLRKVQTSQRGVYAQDGFFRSIIADVWHLLIRQVHRARHSSASGEARRTTCEASCQYFLLQGC